MKNQERPMFVPEDSKEDQKIIEGLISGDVEKVGGDYVASMSAGDIQEMRQEALAEKTQEEEVREIEEAVEDDRKKFGIGEHKDEWEKIEEQHQGDEWKK